MEKHSFNTIAASDRLGEPANNSGIYLFARPLDPSAEGFFFSCTEEFVRLADRCRNGAGESVDAFEIHFAAGREIDAALFAALEVDQQTFGAFLDACAAWDERKKIRAVIAAGAHGHRFVPGFDPDRFEVEVYEAGSFRELARRFVEQGQSGNLPASLVCYVDFGAIARDLESEFRGIRIAGTTYLFRRR